MRPRGLSWVNPPRSSPASLEAAFGLLLPRRWRRCQAGRGRGVSGAERAGAGKKPWERNAHWYGEQKVPRVVGEDVSGGILQRPVAAPIAVYIPESLSA